jgi:hypothetical protein
MTSLLELNPLLNPSEIVRPEAVEFGSGTVAAGRCRMWSAAARRIR